MPREDRTRCDCKILRFDWASGESKAGRIGHDGWGKAAGFEGLPNTTGNKGWVRIGLRFAELINLQFAHAAAQRARVDP